MSLESEDDTVTRTRDGPLALAGELEETFLGFVERYSLQLLRYALVVVFVWFGVLTATGVSETAGLVADVFWFVPSETFLIVLGGWQVVVGLALLSERTLRLAAVLFAAYAAVALAPLVLFPSETFTYFPYGPSFEGVYIIKDWVLLGGTMTVAGRSDTSE